MTRSWTGRGPAGLALAAAIVLTALLPGCSGRPSVSGKVTFDGAPVDGGTISFIGPSPNTQVNADIVGGKYSLSSGSGPFRGKNRVEILWNKKTGKKVPVAGDPGTTTDQTQQVIPAQYNTNSTLSVDVGSGSNTFDFDLKSK